MGAPVTPYGGGAKLGAGGAPGFARGGIPGGGGMFPLTTGAMPGGGGIPGPPMLGGGGGGILFIYSMRLLNSCS